MVVLSIVGSAVLITSQASYNSLSEAIEKVLFCIQSSTAYLVQQIDSSRNGSTKHKRIKLATPKTSRAILVILMLTAQVLLKAVLKSSK